MNPGTVQQLPLRDIHLPTEPGLWPPAPGWWIVATILLLVLLGLALGYHRYRQRHKKWHQIHQLWLSIQQDFQSHGDAAQLARDLSNLLRRFTRHELNNPEAAGLAGDQWIAFLNNDLPEPVFEPLAKTLNSGLYQPQYEYATEPLLQAVHQFLRHHCLQTNRRQP